MKRLTAALLAVLLAAAFGATANAQYTPPGGPTLPVELEYFRPQQGVLDNYNQFVAPRYQLANQLRTMQQEQRTSFRTLEERIQQSDQIREVTAAPTGTAAGFMNYSHYYGMRGGAVRGGARRR
jgi:hypothetical protein